MEGDRVWVPSLLPCEGEDGGFIHWEFNKEALEIPPYIASQWYKSERCCKEGHNTAN